MGRVGAAGAVTPAHRWRRRERVRVVRREVPLAGLGGTGEAGMAQRYGVRARVRAGRRPRGELCADCSGDRGVARVAVGIHMRIANRLCFLQNIKRKK